jgi:hypothetical protein
METADVKPFDIYDVFIIALNKSVSQSYLMQLTSLIPSKAGPAALPTFV